ncbi:hypothetical protein Lepto7375DRAFT_0883 [Leptolyngbya sp. PCC 7375]|nr:hypothetical protein Lepto7375DRAFT_0883 [Leptolyngbya sp. PCC 7375]
MNDFLSAFLHKAAIGTGAVSVLTAFSGQILAGILGLIIAFGFYILAEKVNPQ